MRTVRVSVSKPYDILIDDGLLDRCGAEVAALFRPARLALMTDEHVEPLLADRARASLQAAGFSVKTHVIAAGAKGLDALSGALGFLGAHHFQRSDPLLWLGGGAVADVCGLAAALFEHGMYAVQIPTTLVAALECTLGGRHTVDLPQGRNMVCATALPSLSLCDTQILAALPDRLLRDGTAELLKYALLGSEPLLRLLESGTLHQSLDVAVELCVRIRMEIVRSVEYDPSAWHLLRMGSIVARAVQACSGGSVAHGDALAVGLLAMARAAAVMIPGGVPCADRVEAALRACGMDGSCEYGRGELLTAVAEGRRRDERYLTIAAPVRVGECALKRVTMDDLSQWLAAAGIAD